MTLSSFVFIRLIKVYRGMTEGELGELPESDTDDMLEVINSYQLEDRELFPDNTYLEYIFTEQRHPTIEEPVTYHYDTPISIPSGEYPHSHASRYLTGESYLGVPVSAISMQRCHCRRPEEPDPAILACRFKTTQTPYDVPGVGAGSGPLIFTECGVSPTRSVLLEVPGGGGGATFYNEDRLMMFDLEPYPGAPVCCDPSP